MIQFLHYKCHLLDAKVLVECMLCCLMKKEFIVALTVVLLISFRQTPQKRFKLDNEKVQYSNTSTPFLLLLSVNKIFLNVMQDPSFTLYQVFTEVLQLQYLLRLSVS